MDLKKLLSQKQTLIHQEEDDGSVLKVKETEQYRWFEYGGLSIQSLMNKRVPEQILMPVCQSLLLFLLFPEILLKSKPLRKKTLNVLNLGVGGASIERALATIPDLLLTSVDTSQAIIDMAKRYFNLPQEMQVVCQNAEQFIQQTNTSYDVVLCDLFIGDKSPEFLFRKDFYLDLSKITVSNSVVLINLQANTDEQLLHALLAIKIYFPYIALIEFDDYTNIVIIASPHEIPTRKTLLQRFSNIKQADSTCFLNSNLEQAIEKMRYIPHNKN